MLSKFFIDRPIFATVLSVVITLTGFIAWRFFLPVAQYPRITPPSVQVSINYPGASAQVVADTIAAPIEQQVTGVPGMLYMSSQMGNDGSYSLSVIFDVATDLNTALVMVQNRVALAMPLLPTPVQNQGITIRKKTPDNLCMVNFVSAVEVVRGDGKLIRGFVKGDDEKTLTLLDFAGKKHKIAKSDIASLSPPIHDDIFMSNYAVINVKDELLRVEGVSDVSIMGQRDYSIRVWLDPQKLAARGMSAGDVSDAIKKQNIQAAIGQIGQPPTRGGQTSQLPLSTLGRLTEPEDFGNIIIKAAPSQPPASIAITVPVEDDSVGGASLKTTGLNASIGGGTTGGGATGGGVATANPTSSAPGNRPAASAVNKAVVKSANLAKGPASPSVAIVRLKDVARVETGALNYNQSVTFDGGPSVGINVYQLPTSNALDVADRVRAKMKELKKRFPDGLDYAIAYDTSPFIRESIAEVYSTLRDAVILVALVVLFFLQDWRAMILPMIDVPVSLIGTFAVMAVMGYSLNNISLFGLVLAIGIVVDDAIVVLENIERQMAKGLETRAATIKAMEEISGPILAITLVLCAVFVPCAFISGITGRFFRQFAVTIAASTIISAINALTMTPSRALLIFKSKEGHGHGRKPEALPWWIFGLLGMATLTYGPLYFAGPLGLPMPDPDGDDFEIPEWQSWATTALFFTPGLLVGLAIGWVTIRPVNFVLGGLFRGFNRLFDMMTNLYGWIVGHMLRFSAIVLIAYCGLLFMTYTVFQDTPRGFVPQQDMGRLIVSVQLPDSAGMERTKVVVAQVDDIIRKTPGVAHTVSLAGISFIESANGSNFGSFFVILKPFSQRQKASLRADGIMARMRKQFAEQVKDGRVVVSGSSPIPGISTSGGFKIMVQDRGGLGLPTLQDQTDKFIRKITQQIGEEGKKKKLDEEDGEPRRAMLAGVSTAFRSNTPQLFMEIDRAKVAALGVSFDDANQTLAIYLGSSNVNRYNAHGRTWQVTVQADARFRSRIEDVNLLTVRNDKGEMVPLGTLVKVRESTGPLFVRRYNLSTAAPIGGTLLPGVSSGDVIEAVDRMSAENLPRSMKTEWTELMFLQIREGNTTGIVFGLAVVCVFLALAALYESWTLPLAVILVVPLCVLCSLIGVRYMSSSLNIFVQIGLVVLVGLACKNAILVVEFAKELHTAGKSLHDATVESSRLRLRPILMTSFAFILGVLPLCVASGAGAEMRKSLGIAVFSGMLGVTLFGIFLTPVFFYVIQGIGETRLFAGRATQWIGSILFGGLLGGIGGYLLGQLDVIHATWGTIVGAGLGMLGVAAMRGIHRTMRRPKAAPVSVRDERIKGWCVVQT